MKTEIAAAAWALSRLGLVTAYGHVSARDGASMLITPAADLNTVTESGIVTVPLTATALPRGAPAEAWAHLALYRSRPDAQSIARAQPPSAFAVAASTSSLAPVHGQAAWLGESVPVHDSALLLRSPDLAEHAARALPSGEALLLRGNGAITLGATPGIAVTRMWLLSAACDAYLAAPAATPLTAEEIASWRAVRDELLPRLWAHLRLPVKGFISERTVVLGPHPYTQRAEADPSGSASAQFSEEGNGAVRRRQSAPAWARPAPPAGARPFPLSPRVR